jgi:hypothetical protein
MGSRTGTPLIHRASGRMRSTSGLASGTIVSETVVPSHGYRAALGRWFLASLQVCEIASCLVDILQKLLLVKRSQFYGEWLNLVSIFLIKHVGIETVRVRICIRACSQWVSAGCSTYYRASGCGANLVFKRSRLH